MAVQTQIQVRRGTASSWTSTNPTLAAGEIGFESDTGKIKVGTGSATWNSLTYIGAANAIQYVYNASAGQTTFSGADANGATLSYTVGAEQVYVNGVLQVRNTDYTATNGTSVVLTTATIASDIVTIIAYGTFSVADTYTQAQANATFPLNTSAFFAGKNKIINGDFGVWQRGTTFNSIANGSFTADRWQVAWDGSPTVNVTQQAFTPGTAPVTGYESAYFLRVAETAVSSSTVLDVRYRIEDVRTFAGQTATLSFWAKADSARTLTIAAINQDFGTGGSTAVGVTPTTSSFNLTTSWQRFTTTMTFPSIAGKTIGTNNLVSVFLRNTASSSLVFDLWGVQWEAGSVATAFQTATGTIQGELAACQRYFCKSYDVNVAPATNADTKGLAVYGFGSITSQMVYGNVRFPVAMRTAPTVTTYSFTNSTTNKASQASDGSDLAASSAIVAWAGMNSVGIQNNSGGTISPAQGVIFHYKADAEL